MAQPRYQVIERIDAGGMAEVFKAESTSMQGFQKLVAIKRVLPSLTKNERFVRMFLDEAKVSLHLNHTNCVQVFDLGIADGTYFIVMEYINGTDLKKVLEQLARDGAFMPVEQAVYMAIEICKGLSHAHNKLDLNGQPLDIVHRDISPPNVLLSREGEVKITDFGLAKAQSQVETTDPGVVKGKFGYLSPEAAHGEAVDLRTDVFAVGILLWEMLVGKRLFLGRSDYDTLKLVQDARIPSLQEYRSDVPHQLAQIVEKALAKDINYRYQDCKSLASDLAEFLFSWGRSVTSYDVAILVQDVMAVRSGKAQRVDDARINEVVQREINKLKTLEQIDNLDLYLATTYTSTSSYDDLPAMPLGSLEDPASWAMDLDMGTDDDDVPFMPAAGSTADTWAKADISQIMKAESIPQALDSDEDDTDMLSRQEMVAQQQQMVAAEQQAMASAHHAAASAEHYQQQQPQPNYSQQQQHQQQQQPAQQGITQSAFPAMGQSAASTASSGQKVAADANESNKTMLMAVAALLLLVVAALGVGLFMFI